MSCKDHPIPPIMVGREYDDAVIGNYMRKKHLALSEFIGKPETCYLPYTATDFRSLIEQIASIPGAAGLRIYFASYWFTGVPSIDRIVQAGYKEMLTLIYAATDAKGIDLGEYYMISPFGGVFPITVAAGNVLVNAYRNFKIPLLVQIMITAGKPDFQETRSLWIELDKFTAKNGYLSEMECQQVYGVSAFIGAFPEGYRFPGMPDYDPTWQMTLVLVFIKPAFYNGTQYLWHFDIEDDPHYEHRKKLAGQGQGSGNLKGGDTLNPCPPSTNCGKLG